MVANKYQSLQEMLDTNTLEKLLRDSESRNQQVENVQGELLVVVLTTATVQVLLELFLFNLCV